MSTPQDQTPIQTNTTNSSTSSSLFLPQTPFNNLQDSSTIQSPINQSSSGTTPTSLKLDSTLFNKPVVVTANRLPAHLKALESIAYFLQSKSCYDILPESFRLVPPPPPFLSNR